MNRKAHVELLKAYLDQVAGKRVPLKPKLTEVHLDGIFEPVVEGIANQGMPN
jgi:hypothetical protein